MFLLVGLGNPGVKFQLTRHNFGFLVIDYLVDDYKFSSPINKFDGQIFSGEIAGEKIMAIKPQSFMNLSGMPVQKMMRLQVRHNHWWCFVEQTCHLIF